MNLTYIKDAIKEYVAEKQPVSVTGILFFLRQSHPEISVSTATHIIAMMVEQGNLCQSLIDGLIYLN